MGKKKEKHEDVRLKGENHSAYSSQTCITDEGFLCFWGPNIKKVEITVTVKHHETSHLSAVTSQTLSDCNCVTAAVKYKFLVHCLTFFVALPAQPTAKRPGASLEISGGRPHQPGGTWEGGRVLYQTERSSLHWRRTGLPWVPRDRPPAS